jgi:hypothetical protein
MDDRSGFEARAIIAPRRRRLARATLLVPVVALVAIAWVGASGARPDHLTAIAPASAVPASGVRPWPPRPTEAPYPAEVVGFTVHRLDSIEMQKLAPDEVVAIAGWYSPQLVAACPPVVALGRPSLGVQDGIDPYAYCARTGVFYATQPEPDAPVVIDSIEGVGSRSAGLESVAASMITGVVAPPALEVVGGDAAEVVVLAHFVDSGAACRGGALCRELLIDYVPWTPGS